MTTAETEIRPDQIWMTQPWRLRQVGRRRLLKIVAVHPETVAYVTYADDMAGQPKVRRGNHVSRTTFLHSHSLYREAP